MTLGPVGVRAVLFDFLGVIATVRMALVGEDGNGPYCFDINDELMAAITDLRSNGYKTALITNNTRSSMSSYSWFERVEQSFDACVFAGDLGPLKPDPRVFTRVLQLLGVEASETLFLDDSLRNVEAAVNLGMQGVVIDRPEDATHVLADLIS